MRIEYNEKFNFNHIKAEEGMVITDYTEDKNIIDYSSSKEMYAPVNVDLNVYFEITDEKDVEYKAAQEKAIEEEREKIELNIKEKEEETKKEE